MKFFNFKALFLACAVVVFCKGADVPACNNEEVQRILKSIVDKEFTEQLKEQLNAEGITEKKMRERNFNLNLDFSFSSFASNEIGEYNFCDARVKVYMFVNDEKKEIEGMVSYSARYTDDRKEILVKLLDLQ